MVGKRNKWGIFWVLACGMVGCNETSSPVPVAPPAAELSMEALLARGESVYDETCAICHYDGKGSDVVPPLMGAPAVSKGEPSDLLRIILRGQQGRLERGGRTFNGVMPPMAYLSDEEIASVATYVRKVHGNSSDPVQPGQVRNLR
jgi:mono/diheme cytochrome c family protein